MTSFGYTLSSEEHGPQTLVANARRAEELGFDFVSISDHYHPWVDAPRATARSCGRCSARSRRRPSASRSASA